MPEPDLFLLFIRPFNRSGIRYVVTGSVATTFYGEPRLTHDVDLVVLLAASDIPKLFEMFPSPEFYLPPVENITAETQRSERGHFNVIHANTSFKADIYVAGRDELNAFAFRFSRKVDYDGETISMAPAEYVIIRKLEYYREGGSQKHLRDIRSMLVLLGDKIDRAVLQDWVQRLSLEKQWQLVSS
jgi:hypothetical protein